MKAYLANTFPDEEGPLAEEGKSVYIHGSKEKLLAVCDFFAKVAKELKDSETCHMHLMDTMEGWNRSDDVDISIEINN